MTMNKALIALALGFALAACSNSQQAADSAADAQQAATELRVLAEQAAIPTASFYHPEELKSRTFNGVAASIGANVPLWTGGAFGPEAGLIGILATLLGCLATLWWIRWRYGRITLCTALTHYAPPLPGKGKPTTRGM